LQQGAVQGSLTASGAVPHRRWTLGVVALAAVAAATRVAMMAATPRYRPHHDDHSYLMHALALVRTHAYPVFHFDGHPVPTAYRAPGLPFALAAVHLLGGGGLDAQRALQVVAGTAVVVLVAVVARQVWGPRTALVAGALAAVSPVLVLFGGSLISEPLFTAFTLGALACALHARGRLPWALAAGALAAAAALTRSEGLALAFGVAMCAGSRRATVATLLATVACVAPWTVRNALVLHAFVPINTETGNALAGTYNDRSAHDGRWRDPRAFHLYPAALAAHRTDEAGTDRALTHAALVWVAAHPLDPLRVAAANGGRLAGIAPTSFSRLSLGSISLPTAPAPLLRLTLLVTTALGIVGACTHAARRAPPGWWWCAAALALTGLLVNAEQRFALPLQPFLLMLGALPFTRGR